MSNGRRFLIAGNWKMNGLQADGRALAEAIVGRATEHGPRPFDMLVCPPFPLLATLSAAIAGSTVALGAQDCHVAQKGAHTGDISAPMLVDVGCSYVIVGHSERRINHGEENALVRAKAEAAMAAGLVPIICIGETEAQRDAGKTLDVNREQLTGSLPEGATAAGVVIAYEPVWAIGTGRTATPDQAQEVHAFIRGLLVERLGPAEGNAVRILYGGSMNPKNARELLARADVDGGLIGGASLKAEDFWAVAEGCL
jgi:triosephosphate isomerase (TIM)